MKNAWISLLVELKHPTQTKHLYLCMKYYLHYGFKGQQKIYAPACTYEALGRRCTYNQLRKQMKYGAVSASHK